MRFKVYKRIAISVISLVCVAAGIATASFSYSWFTNRNDITKQITGKTAGAYFGGGDGKSDNPYIISKPIHLYNLAWLYYIGFFKGQEPYFKITADLKMSDWNLPPIGTSTNPFNGHLDGGSYTISNLNVTNDFTSLSSKKPSSVTESDWNGNNDKYGPTPNILGLFGYISQESSDKGVPSVKNLKIDGESVTSSTSTALTGIVAGYVNGSLDGIYINDSTVSLADGTKPLGTLEGGVTISNISEYTSVGYCAEDYRTKYTRYETTLYEPTIVASTSKDTYKPGGSGQEENWGGSIDIGSLSKRITYMKWNIENLSRKNSSGQKQYPTYPSSTYGKTYSSSTYNISLYETRVNTNNKSVFYFDWDTFNPDLSASATNSWVAFQEGTYLPLNIDLEKASIVDSDGNDLDESSTPALGSFYDGSTTEPVKNNTGYLVGRGSSGNAYPRIQKQKSEASSSSMGIRYSVATQLSGKDETSDATMFSSSNFAFYMYDSSSKTTKRIEDSDNKTNASTFEKSGISDTVESSKFKKYVEVKTNFIKMLESSSKNARQYGKLLLEALRIYNLQNYDFNSDILTASNVYFGNGSKPYSNYQFAEGGINFTVKKTGFITILIGTYASNSNKHGCLDLYQVQRNSNNEITSFSESTRVKQVYTSDDGKTISYNNSTTEAGNLAIDLDSMSKSSSGSTASQGVLQPNSVYYLEIPVTPGDYFLSKIKRSDSAPTNLPYILYLDIGANAGDDGSSGETVTRTKVFELLKQITEAFTYPTGVYVTDFDNAALDTKTLCITLGSTYSGKATISMNGNNANLVVNSDSSTNTGISYYDLDFTLSNNGSEITSSDIIEGEQSITTTKRMTYYDYNSDDSTLRMFRFSQSKTDEEEYGEITAETQYYATYSDSSLSSWTETSGETVYNDDGTSTEETKGIPNPLATEGIAIPTDYSESSNVFDLQLKVNKKDSFTSTYLPAVTLGANNVTSIYGYDFEMKNGENKISSDDYNLTRNDKYCLKINDEEYKQA